MRKIKIEISKARIESYSITFDEADKINISTTIGLYTEQNKKITTYSLSTESWNKETQVELPLEVIDPIKKIGQALEIVATRHIRRGQKALSVPNKENDD